MKRVAESQLTKDGGDNEEESEDAGVGFKKADPSTLSGRRIRGLPKRGLNSPAASPAGITAPAGPPNGAKEETPESTSRFGGFAGFGNGSTSSPFTFTLPGSQSKPTVSQAPPAVSSGSNPSPSASQPFKGSAFLPTVSTASPAATPTTAPSSTPISADPQIKRNAAQKYCLTLRGLNTSFLEAITQAVKADPFLDISDMLEKYRSLRSSAQNDFNAISSSPTSGQGEVPAASPVTPQTSRPIPSMPVPPKFSFFGNKTSTSGAVAPQSVGFTPKLGDQPLASPFASPGKASATDKLNALGTHGTNEKTPLQGTPVTSGKQVAATSLGSPAIVFGSAEPQTPETKAQPLKGREGLREKKETPFNFTFGASTSAAPLTPGFSSFKSSPKPTGVATDTSTPSTKKPSFSNTSPPSAPAFGFGTGKNLGGSATFSPFGKGSIGNPVGFAFGSPPTTPSVVESPDPPPAATSDTADVGPSAGVDATDGSSSAPSHDPSPAPSQGSAYDVDGPGEEDEVTLHETKSKAYKMTSSGATKGWVSVGSGQLKLKARVDAPKRRLLMRNTSTGQIILNFNLFPGFKVTADKKAISFRVPGNDESAAVYQLRVPSEDDAMKWEEAVQKEVDSLSPSRET